METMDKTILYKDEDLNKLFSYEDIKKDYIKATISDGDVESFIDKNVTQNGGNISIIDDKILKWCNDYVDENANYQSQAERDRNVKFIYECISSYMDMIVGHFINDGVDNETLEYLTSLL